MWALIFILYAMISVVFVLYWLLRNDSVFFQRMEGVDNALTFIILLLSPIVLPFIMVGIVVPKILTQLHRLKPVEEKITHFIKTGRIKW